MVDPYAECGGYSCNLCRAIRGALRSAVCRQQVALELMQTTSAVALVEQSEVIVDSFDAEAQTEAQLLEPTVDSSLETEAQTEEQPLAPTVDSSLDAETQTEEQPLEATVDS